MKRIAFLLLSACIAWNMPATAQNGGIDSTTLEKQITLTKDQHKHVIRGLGTGSMAAPERINYINALIDAGFNTKSDTAKLTVTVTLGLIVDAFRAASQKPEGVVVNDNAATKAAIFPQIQNIPWVLNSIIAIIGENAARNQGEKNEVEAYLQKIKK